MAIAIYRWNKPGGTGARLKLTYYISQIFNSGFFICLILEMDFKLFFKVQVHLMGKKSDLILCQRICETLDCSCLAVGYVRSRVKNTWLV